MRCRPALAVGQLAFVDDESGFVLAIHDLRNDLVEGHDFGFNPGREKLQREIGGGQCARDRDFLALDFALRKSLRGNNHRAVAVATLPPLGSRA